MRKRKETPFANQNMPLHIPVKSVANYFLTLLIPFVHISPHTENKPRLIVASGDKRIASQHNSSGIYTIKEGQMRLPRLAMQALVELHSFQNMTELYNFVHVKLSG